jgi:hypothetical protein
MRKIGIIITLIGIGLFVISILFSEGYDPRLNIIYNMYNMKIVICPGRVVDEGPRLSAEEWERRAQALNELAMGKLPKEHKKYLDPGAGSPTYKIVGRWEIPLNHLLSLSTVITLVGVGIILLTKNKNETA